MDYYLGVFGVLAVVNNLQEAQSIALDLEPHAIQGICDVLYRAYRWSAFNRDKEQGVFVSVLGHLYTPSEYVEWRVSDLHRDIGFSLVKTGEVSKHLDLPPPPTPPTEIDESGTILLRVIPLFAYGDVNEVRRLVTHRVPSEEIAAIIGYNLNVTPSSISVYNDTVDFDRVMRWAEKVRQDLTGLGGP